jgi:hypothetical protein
MINFAKFYSRQGAAFAADGTKSKYFGRSSFTRWVVPIDDHHCVALAWANFGERGDPIEYDNQEGYERIEAGEISNRTKEEKQQVLVMQKLLREWAQ